MMTADQLARHVLQTFRGVQHITEMTNDELYEVGLAITAEKKRRGLSGGDFMVTHIDYRTSLHDIAPDVENVTR